MLAIIEDDMHGGFIAYQHEIDRHNRAAVMLLQNRL